MNLISRSLRKDSYGLRKHLLFQGFCSVRAPPRYRKAIESALRFYWRQGFDLRDLLGRVPRLQTLLWGVRDESAVESGRHRLCKAED